MKYRDRITAEVKEVYRTAFLDGHNYYLFTDGKWGNAVCYEPIPTETWRDVTGECVWRGNNLYHGNQKVFVGTTGGIHPDYTLRKARVSLVDKPYPPRDAFIVEKKENA
jgi:hypothetical protein